VSNRIVIDLDRAQAEQLLNLIDSGRLDGSNVGNLEKLREATVASILRHKRKIEEFDVFLCHNTTDKIHVKRIGKRLKKYGILPWLDEWELRPGIPWQRTLERQINSIRAAAIFVGDNGIGPWQNLELEAFIRQFVSRQCPVIPVLLNSSANEPELPVFLNGMTYVHLMRKKPDPFAQLIWGITGVHPDAQV
jgi:hypothetical protein